MEHTITDRDWLNIKLGDFAQRITKGGTPTTYGYAFQDRGINFIKVENVKNGNIEIQSITDFISAEAHAFQKKSQLSEEDILFSIAGTIGETCIVKKEHLPANTNQALSIIKGTSKYIKPTLLKYQLDAFVAKVKAKARGGAMNNVSLADLKNLFVNIPPPKEQIRLLVKIEELFSSLDKGIESLKTAQQQLKVYRQAVLKWAFEGKLTNKNVAEGELPEGWEQVNLKELVDKISDGPFGSNLKSSDYVENGVRVIRLENIGYMEFRNEFKSFVTKDKYETIKKHTVSKGDIIFSSFVSENIRAVILPDFIDKAINKADCFLVRSSKDKISNKYLLFYFSTREMYHQLIGEIHGATRPRINTTQLKSCHIPLAPLPEQNAIVAEIESRLSVCDKIEESIEQSLKQAETLRQSILKKAFEGKLVPQDPNDEPASILLARIKAEREKNEPENLPRRQARKAKTKKAKS